MTQGKLFASFCLVLSMGAISCAKPNDSESDVNFRKKNGASLLDAKTVLAASCLQQAEKDAKAAGKLPPNVSCGQAFISDHSQFETMQKVCTDDIPKACGLDPQKAQDTMAKAFPKLDKVGLAGLTPFQSCLRQAETEIKAKDPQKYQGLQCGQPVIGAEAQARLSSLCTDQIVDKCRVHLPVALRDIDKNTQDYIQDGSGKIVKVQPIADNPACAPNNRGKYSADCSQVTVRTTEKGLPFDTTYQLTRFQRCMNSKVVLFRKGGVSDPVIVEANKILGANWDCGMMVIRDDAQRALSRVCDKITTDCQREIPDYAQERMQVLQKVQAAN